MKKLLYPLFLSFVLIGNSACAEAHIVSAVWKDYEEARLSGKEPMVADFSYVGYHTGIKKLPATDGKVFDVTSFGAIPNDDQSDKAAVLAAIAAAEKNGSGIVFFPAGRFRLNEESDPHNEPIFIRTSNIVLRGSGSGPNGTELFFERHMDPADPKKLWTCPYTIQIIGNGETKIESSITSVSRRETFSVSVQQPENFQVGDWVKLVYKDNSPEAVAKALAAYEPDPRWKSIVNDGVQINEIHRVKSIEENQITFAEPMHVSIGANESWKLQKLEMLEEIGIEDLAFVGNWQEDFVHHKNAIHDGGWSAVELLHCANSWIRDCRFTDLNRPVSLKKSAAVTVQDIILDGNPGHSAITLQWTSHSLVQRVVDTASHWHASGVAHNCSGNVFLRSEYSANTCFESHAAQPRWTLMDNISGGWLYGRWGGALFNQPNHLEGLIFWNYENTGAGEEGAFHFMRPDEISAFGRIIMPYVIGFHGNPQEWVESEIKVLESNGAPVYPESLYEAQLSLRLQHLEKDNR